MPPRKPTRWSDLSKAPGWSRAGLVSALPFVGSGGTAKDFVLPTEWTLGNAPSWVIDQGERRLSFNFDGDSLSRADSSWFPTGPISIVLKYRKTDGTDRAVAALAVNSASAGERCLTHIPYSDGTVYWDYGGATVGSTRVAVPSLTFGDDVWVFTVGPRGMEVWQNGVLRGSNSAIPTRSASAQGFGFGSSTNLGLAADRATVSAFLCYNRQLNAAEIAALSKDPFLPFRQEDVAKSELPLAWEQAFNFRSLLVQSGFDVATDAGGETPVIDATLYPAAKSVVPYPTLFGWQGTDPTDNDQPRYFSKPLLDRRLLGGHFNQSGTDSIDFRVDLDSLDPVTVHLALGHGGGTFNQQLEVRDGNGLLFSCGPTSVTDTQVMDAQGNVWSETAWPASEQGRRVTPTTPYLLFRLLPDASGDLSCVRHIHIKQDGHGALPKYEWRAPVSIDHTKVSGGDQTNFPVLFTGTFPELKSTANGGRVRSASGFDIIFTGDVAGRQRLDHELVKYDPTTGYIEAWFRAPVLSSAANSTFYLWFGNVNILASQANPAGVWDAAFAGIYHLGDGTTLSLGDSTANARTLTNYNGATAAAGIIDGGAAFVAASSQQLGMPAVDLDSGFAVSAWVKPTANGQGTYRRIFENLYYTGTALTSDNSAPGGFIFMVGGTSLSTVGALTPGVWQHVAGVYDGTTASFYLNGALATSATPTAPILGSFALGWAGGAPGNLRPFFDGTLDECRVSLAARSAGWIGTEYNNQNAPSTFFSLGTAQPLGYEFSKAVTVNHAQVPNTDQTNFPVGVIGTLADLKHRSFGGRVRSMDGHDIIFTSDSAGTTKLDWDLDSYDPKTGKIVVWVRIPTLSHSADTTFYMWFGNRNITQYQGNRAGTWDAYFDAVYHLGNGPVLHGADATAHANNAVRRNGPAPVTGAFAGGTLGGACAFDGVSQYLDAGTSDVTGQVPFTLSAWVKAANTVQSTAGYGGALGIGLGSSDQMAWVGWSGSLHSYGGGLYGDNMDSSVTDLTAFHHVVVTSTGSSSALVSLYVDGVFHGSMVRNVTLAGNARRLGVLDNNGLLDYWWAGETDEARISTVARSADWIVTEYNNQNAPSTFLTFGATTWFAASQYGFKAAYTVQHGQVGTGGVTNFPVLFTGTFAALRGVPYGGTVRSPLGWDIAFTSDSAGAAKLYHELVTYNAVTGYVEAWVTVPALSDTADTPFYVWTCNPLVITSDSTTDTWDANFVAVYHYGDTTTLSLGDSTANARTLTNHNGATAAAGPFGGCAGLDESSGQYLTTAYDGTGDTARTVAMMVKYASTPSVQEGMFSWHNPPDTDAVPFLLFAAGSDGHLKMYADGNYRIDDVAFAAGTWYWIAATYDGAGGWTFYKNGVATGYAGSNPPALLSEATTLFIGFGYNDSFSGLVDETRVSTVARSAAWIHTEFNNQSNPAGFGVLSAFVSTANVRTRYVNTASTSGGDGTTNATTGANRAYPSLAAAISAEAAHLVFGNNRLEVLCTGSAADTTMVSVSGFVVDAPHYVRIIAASGQEAQTAWSTSRYRLEAGYLPLVLSTDYTRVERLQIGTTTDDNNLTGVLCPDANVSLLVYGCYIRSKDQAYTFGSHSTGIDGGTDAQGDRYFIDNIVEWDFRAGATVVYAIQTTQHLSGKTYVYNCTVVSRGVTTAAIGIHDGFAKMVLKNNLVKGFLGGDYSGITAGNATNNASDDTTATGTGARTSQTFSFVGGGDYAITSGDTGAKDQGIDLSNDPFYAFTTDMVGTTRPQGSAWDIGAFEYVSAGGGGAANASGTPSMPPLGSVAAAQAIVKAAGLPALHAASTGTAQAIVKAAAVVTMPVLAALSAAQAIVKAAGSALFTSLHAAGATDAIVKSSGTPSMVPLASAGAAKAIVKAAGLPSSATLGSSGAAKAIVKAQGSDTMPPLDSTSASQAVVKANGSTSMPPLSGTGDAEGTSGSHASGSDAMPTLVGAGAAAAPVKAAASPHMPTLGASGATDAPAAAHGTVSTATLKSAGATQAVVHGQGTAVLPGLHTSASAAKAVVKAGGAASLPALGGAGVTHAPSSVHGAVTLPALQGTAVTFAPVKARGVPLTTTLRGSGSLTADVKSAGSPRFGLAVSGAATVLARATGLSLLLPALAAFGRAVAAALGIPVPGDTYVDFTLDYPTVDFDNDYPTVDF